MGYHETMLLAAPLMTLLLGLTIFEVKKRPVPKFLLAAAGGYFAAMTYQYGPAPWWSYPAGMVATLLLTAPLRWLMPGAWRLDETSWLTGGLVGFATGLEFALLFWLLYCSLQGAVLALQRGSRSDPFPPIALMMLSVVALMVTVRNIVPQWGFG